MGPVLVITVGPNGVVIPSDLVPVDPEAALESLLEIAATTDDGGLFWVADIAEDLVIRDAATFVPRIETEARMNPRFRTSLLDLTPTANDEDLNRRLLGLREEIEWEAAILVESRDIGER